jgi:two-component system sensor histidine kinase TctE
MRLRSDVEAREPTDLSDFDPALVHREVRPLVAAVNGYMKRLQTLINGQRRFIADASHQLRTPLTVLKTQAELALRENDPQAMRAIVESIARTTDATVHLANRLLMLARAEHSAAEGQMQMVSLVETARGVALELAQAAVKKGIDLSFEAEGDVSVHANELLLHEMIVNLLDNAIQYTPSGGKVAVRVLGGSDVRLEIEDSGPGIAPGDRERVFSPFYRVPSAQEANAGGTGLGLAIVRDIAASHRARIELADAGWGSGLRIAVHFPRDAH